MESFSVPMPTVRCIPFTGWWTFRNGPKGRSERHSLLRKFYQIRTNMDAREPAEASAAGEWLALRKRPASHNKLMWVYSAKRIYSTRFSSLTSSTFASSRFDR